MTERERRHHPYASGGPADGVAPTGAQASSLHSSARAFLSAADHAIARALSRDSRRFLRDCGQEGGQ